MNTYLVGTLRQAVTRVRKAARLCGILIDRARFKRGVNEAGSWDQIRYARFWDRGIPEVTRKVNT